MNRKNETVRSVVLGTVRRQPLLCTALVLAVAGAVAASLLPPLVLGRVVDRLTARQVVPFALALGYFGLLALSGGLDSLRESLLTVFGQKMTHALRSAMCAKLDKLPAEAFVNQESGAAVSRFVGDVDTVEELFTSGIISMFADACRLCGILAVIFAENRGLALILLVVLPLLYLFTRVVQKRMLKAQLQNRAAVARASAHVPETLRCIRTIHTLRRENYMEKAYDEALDDSFAAVEKTNFYDACYSPVILIMNAAVVALVMLLSAAAARKCGRSSACRSARLWLLLPIFPRCSPRWKASAWRLRRFNPLWPVCGASTVFWRRQSASPPLKPPRRLCRVPPAWS